jgi:hypothetical protein
MIPRARTRSGAVRARQVASGCSYVRGLPPAYRGKARTRRPPPVHHAGLINDYTPSAAVTKGGP